MGSETSQAVPSVELIGVAICLLASAFFSGSETVLTRITDARAKHLLDSDPQRYGILEFWVENKRRILSALLVGNNIVNILCSILAYRIALELLPDRYAEAVSVFGLAALVLVFAEVTPKQLGMQYSEQVAVPVLRLIWMLDKLLWVITAPLSRFPALIAGRAGLAADEPGVTADEIEFQIRLGHDQAVFEEKAQGDLLMSAVEFSETMVKEVMIPRTDVFGLDMTSNLHEAAEAVIESGHSRIPVYREDLDDIVGLLYAKDLLVVGQQPDAAKRTIESIIRKPPFFVPETQKIRDVLSIMRRRGLHMAIVVDEFGGTSGLATLEDIIEELVGEIRDEYDPEESLIRRVDPQTWVVDARVPLNDLRNASGIELPDTGEYESVGGFVIAQYGKIPKAGAVVEIPGVRINVIAANPRHVERLEIRSVPTDSTDDDA